MSGSQATPRGSELQQRFDRVRARIQAAAGRVGRDPREVRLLAVSKTHSVEAVEAAVAAGQGAFGESRVQEAEPKVLRIHAAHPTVEWHMIGPLQRNKARRAAELFDVVQSVDRLALAEGLSRAAESLRKRLRVLVQVNIDEEPQKAGVAPQLAGELLREVAVLPALRVEGLMAIPRWHDSAQAMRPAFARLRSLAQELRLSAPANVDLVELSMGMSDDYEVAIEEGSTCVRVGSALFGRRTP